MLRSLAVLLVFGGLAMAAPLPKATFKKLKDYYPLAKGHKWTYAHAGLDFEVVVTDFEEAKDGTKTATLTTQVGGKDISTEVIRTARDGIYRIQINDDKIDPPLQLLKFDKEDEEWEIKSGESSPKIDVIVKHHGEEKIEVDAGKYTAIKLSMKGEVSGSPFIDLKYWFVENVGIAQISYTIKGSNTLVLKLKAFSPGKEK